MQSDKFTAIVRNAIGSAQTAALSANHQKLTGEHILAALLKDDKLSESVESTSDSDKDLLEGEVANSDDSNEVKTKSKVSKKVTNNPSSDQNEQSKKEFEKILAPS